MSTVTVTETLVDPSTAAYAGWSATVRPVGSESDPAAPVYALGSDHTALGEVVCDVNSSGVWSTTLHPVSELTPSGSRYRISYTAPSGVQAPADVYIEPQTSPSTQRVEDILSTAPGALSAIAASSVTFSPTGTVSSTNVQAAIAEVASEGGASTVDVVSNVASSRILGRTTAGSGDSEELTAAQTKTLLAVTSTDISDFNSAAVSAGSGTYAPIASPTFTGTVTLPGDPGSALQAATKQYVDAQAAGARDVKDSVRAATTANITLSGAQTIDGVSVIAGDRVLVKDQSTSANNGIYVCASGSWTRATDADTSAEVTGGMYVWVNEGTANADTGWLLTTNDPITLGSTSLTFTQVSALGQITAGAALTKSGSTLDVAVDGSTIEVNADALQLKDAGVTLAKMANLAAKTVIMRHTNSTGVPEATSMANLLADASGQNGADFSFGDYAIDAKQFAPRSRTGGTVAFTYNRGTASAAPASGTWVAGDIAPDQTGKFWLCTTGGTPGTWCPMFGLLGHCTYDPASTSTYTTSGALGDVDSTNLLVTFVAPASGTVLVTLTARTATSAAVNAWYGLRESSTQVGGLALILPVSTGSVYQPRTATIKVTGLTPGSSHTYKWAFAASGASFLIKAGQSANDEGAATMTVVAG